MGKIVQVKQSIELEEISNNEFMKLAGDWKINPAYPHDYTGYFRIVKPLIYKSYAEVINDCENRMFTHSFRIFDKGQWIGFKRDFLSEEDVEYLQSVASTDSRKRNHFEVKLAAGHHDASNANEMCGRVRLAEIEECPGIIVTYELEVPRALCSAFHLSSKYAMNRCLLNKISFADRLYGGELYCSNELYELDNLNTEEFGVQIHDDQEL